MRGLKAAAPLFLLALPLTARAQAPGPRVRVGLLKLRSFVARPEELALLDQLLARRMEGAEGVTVVDPTAPLVEKGSDFWLEADKLLYDGMEDYRAVRLTEATEKLKRAAEIGEETWRLYADAQGPRRLREAWLYLGLARLDQGAEDEATACFRKAAAADPAWEIDPKAFPPDARAKYQAAKASLTGPAYPGSREELEPLAERIGVDVVVTGGVSRGRDGKLVLEVAVDDHWKHRLSLDTVEPDGEGEGALAAGLEKSAPRVIAEVLDQSIRPPVLRNRLAFGPMLRASPGTVFAGQFPGVGAGNYRWSGNLMLGGGGVQYRAWAEGPWIVDADLAFIWPQDLSTGTFERGPGVTNFPIASGSIAFGAVAAARFARVWKLGETTVSGGAGLTLSGMAMAIDSYTTQGAIQAQSALYPVAAAPELSVSAAHPIGSRSFVQLQVGGEYDGLLGGPSVFSIRTIAAGGLLF